MRGVSQISPPIRILVIAVLGLMAAWMLFLRPSADVEAPPATPAATAPGVEGLSNAVDAANGAAATQEARDEKLQQATGGKEAAKAGKSGSKGSTPSTVPTSGRVLALAPLEDEATDGLPGDVRRALERRQVLVLGVFDTAQKRWARMAADDRRVRRELSKANRYGGNVAVATTTLRKLNRVDPIIGDLDVSQTPSVVVVDRNRRATVLTGYVERNTINQAIADARRNSIERRIKEPYLRRLNETCANYALRVDRFNLPPSRSGIKPAIGRLSRLVAAYRGAFGRLSAPARFKPLQAHLMRVLHRQDEFVAALKTGNLGSAGQSLVALDLAAAGLDRRLDSSGVTSCVTHRRS
jgi:hypothetical protein